MTLKAEIFWIACMRNKVGRYVGLWLRMIDESKYGLMKVGDLIEETAVAGFEPRELVVLGGPTREVVFKGMLRQAYYKKVLWSYMHAGDGYRDCRSWVTPISGSNFRAMADKMRRRQKMLPSSHPPLQRRNHNQGTESWVRAGEKRRRWATPRHLSSERVSCKVGIMREQPPPQDSIINLTPICHFLIRVREDIQGGTKIRHLQRRILGLCAHAIMNRSHQNHLTLPSTTVLDHPVSKVVVRTTNVGAST
ncbi:hypothetical protein BDN72DRAFT_950062, partial [Pluteus cervinus]